MREGKEGPGGGTAVGIGKPGTVPVSPRVRRVLVVAVEEAGRRGAESVDEVHALLALAREEEGVAAQVLQAAGADYRVIERGMGALAAPAQPAP